MTESPKDAKSPPSKPDADAKPVVKASPKPAVESKQPDASAAPTGVQNIPAGVSEVKRRRTRLILSFVFCVLLPSILGATYYLSYASDRYAAGASFVVRGFDSGGSGDLVSSFTGLTSSGSTTSDSYIIRRYLQSGNLILNLEEQLSLRDHYSDPEIDLLSRYDASQPFEKFVQYWARRITTTYDSTTGIVTFEVQGFDAGLTLDLANTVLGAADALVNELSSDARQDSLGFAVVEVERAEGRLREAQIALRQFRSTTGTVDPTMNAQFDAQLIAELESQLAEIDAQIAALVANVDPGTPILQQLERRQVAIQAQIDSRRAGVGTSDENVTTADSLSLFEGLQIEQTFAQQRYASALASLEQARIDADRLQRYLAVFDKPLTPQEAIYPHRVRNTLLIALAAFVLWSIGTLIVYAVRDHLR